MHKYELLLKEKSNNGCTEALKKKEKKLSWKYMQAWQDYMPAGSWV